MKSTLSYDKIGLLPGETYNNQRQNHKPKPPQAPVHFREFVKLLTATLPQLFPDIDPSMIQEKLGFIQHILTHKGVEYTVRYLKATHESLENLILGFSENLEHEGISIGKDQDGWPKWLGNRLKSNCLIVGNHPEGPYERIGRLKSNHDGTRLSSIRFAFTLCSARRLLTVQTKTDLSSITNPPTWKEKIDLTVIFNDLGGAHRDLYLPVRQPEIGGIETYKSDTITTYKVPKLQISLKSSPNGISYFAFPWDRAAILSHGLEDVLKAFAQKYFRGPVEEWLEEHLQPYEELVDSNRQLNVGKVSLTYETGKLKPRVFAIVDSVTQCLLADFHQDLMSVLRTIPEDCTFDQDKVSSVAASWFNIDKLTYYGCADLSNATDRIPVYLYEEIGNSIRPGLGTAWVELFNREFTVSRSVSNAWITRDGSPTHVRYQCGQPMGALSSWPFMALVHHHLVWYSFGSRKASRGKYLILGDDIVIADVEAHKKYLSVLDILGCSYTNHVSTSGFEFAKRTFLKGVEITGAYTQALWATRNDPELFTLEWRNLASRGYKTGCDLHSDFRTLLKVSRKRFEWCKLLMTVPYGTEIKLEDLAHFCVSLSGRSTCLLHRGRGDTERLVESVKAFRQASALLIKQKFQEDLNAAKSAVTSNQTDFEAQFRLRSGLDGRYTSVMSSALKEVREDSVTRIRYLERDLKLLYLNPTDKQLLRPNLPDIPRRIDFTQRDENIRRMRFRAEHQKNIIEALRS